MKAYTLNQFGSPENFSLTEVKRPTITADEVLIKVAATSINPLDFKIRRGDMPNAINNFPFILHSDVSGTIVELGKNVDHLKVGDEVYGMCGGVGSRPGALAEYVAAPSKLVYRKPVNLSFAESAAVPLTALTAWEASHSYGDTNKQIKILIYGGTGAVGHFAIQLARLKGPSKIYTTVSSEEKAEIAKQLGADVTINYKLLEPDNYIKQCTNGLGFDIVIDTVGGKNFDIAMKATKIRGKVISILAREKYDLSLAASKALNLQMINVMHPLMLNKWHDEHQAALKTITSLIENNKLKVLIDSIEYKMHEIAKAHAYAEIGKNIGKITVTW